MENKPKRRRGAVPPQRGIYAIECEDGRAYVGGSRNIAKRWCDHRYDLRRGTHKNRLLQKAWLTFGETAFQFVVLEVVQNGDLEAAEQRHMTALNTVERGFNLSPTAGSPRGVVHTAETRAKFSAAGLARAMRPGERGRMQGQSNPAAKLSDREVEEIRQMAGTGLFKREIAAIYGITQSNVSRVLSGGRWGASCHPRQFPA